MRKVVHLLSVFFRHTHLPVHQRGGFALRHDIDGLIGEQNAVVHAIAVDGLEPSQAVGVDAALVGFDEDLRSGLGAFGGDAVGEEDVLHEF